ncbi:unnamed protein product [Paramecium sonneborni]|uniref:Uncharacterized protein n=1 Tax=Paramecium sonneborni TaxID=65129 RepID=A0A8S1P5T0_9CILI|nr:unnamed protein product [Paramecium sonneborni]
MSRQNFTLIKSKNTCLEDQQILEIIRRQELRLQIKRDQNDQEFKKKRLINSNSIFPLPQHNLNSFDKKLNKYQDIFSLIELVTYGLRRNIVIINLRKYGGFLKSKYRNQQSERALGIKRYNIKGINKTCIKRQKNSLFDELKLKLSNLPAISLNQNKFLQETQNLIQFITHKREELEKFEISLLQNNTQMLQFLDNQLNKRYEYYEDTNQELIKDSQEQMLFLKKIVQIKYEIENKFKSENLKEIKLQFEDMNFLQYLQNLKFKHLKLLRKVFINYVGVNKPIGITKIIRIYKSS